MLDENWQDREAKVTIGEKITIVIAAAVVALGLLGGALFVWTMLARWAGW